MIYSSNFELEARSETISTPEQDEIAGGGRDGRYGKDSGGMSTAEIEDDARVGRRGGIMESATGVIDVAWGGFESVWGKVMGSGETTMRG